MTPRKTLAGLVALAAAALSLSFAGTAEAAMLAPAVACTNADIASNTGVISALGKLETDAGLYEGLATPPVYTYSTAPTSLTSLTSGANATTAQANAVSADIAALSTAVNVAAASVGCTLSGATTTTVAPTTTAVPAPAAEVPEASVASTGTPACISAIGAVSARWATYDMAFRSSATNVNRTYVAYQRALNEAQATCVTAPGTTAPTIVLPAPAPAVAPVVPAPVVSSGTTTSVTTATVPSSTTGVQTGDGSAPSE
jgi:hypothetical protein